MKTNLTDEEMIIVLEVARLALANDRMFDRTAIDMDLDDKFLHKIKNKLEKYMANSSRPSI
jgi:hypothetical protein